MHKNLKIELTQWKVHKMRGGSFGNNKNFMTNKKKLRELIQRYKAIN